jgi:uncharacterized membrane protein YqjE
VTSGPRDEGPAGAFRALGADLLALLRVRAELLGVELEEGNARRKRMIALAGIGVLFGAVTLQLVAVLVVALFWDTHRLAAAIGVTVVYAGIAVWAFATFREIARNAPPPFSATLAEFRKDLEMLRGTDEPRD